MSDQKNYGKRVSLERDALVIERHKLKYEGQERILELRSYAPHPTHHSHKPREDYDPSGPSAA